MAKTSKFRTVILAAAALTMLARPGWGQGLIHWSAYKTADGLGESAVHHLTLTAQGKVIATSRNAQMADELDGFSVTNFPAPTNYAGRIWESPGGQRWALAADGLMEFKDGRWILRRVPAIAAAIDDAAKGAAVRMEGLPFYAARQGCVLFLLPEGLMEFSSEDPDKPRTMTLRTAAEMGIGRLTDMAVAHDGSLWIVGERGLARAAGPVRNLGTNANWQEFITADNLPARGLTGLEPDDNGGVVAMAEPAGNHGKVVMRFDGRNWAVLPAGPEKFFRAWQGWGGTIWAATSEAVFHWNAARTNWVENQEISAGRIFDVAVEPGGAFWLATADGLFRGAAPLWSPPRTLTDSETPVEGLTLDGDGRPCFVAENKLHIWQDGREREYALPPAADSPGVVKLFAVKNGMVLEPADHRYTFNAAEGTITEPSGADGLGAAKALGLLPDGSLCLYAGGVGKWGAFDGMTMQPLAEAPPAGNGSFDALYVDRAGDWWIGGDREVWWRHNGGWQRFASDDHSTPESVAGFVEGPDGKVWCATLTEIWEFDGKSWMRLPGEFNHVNAVTRSRDGEIWVAGNSGLFRYCNGAWLANGVEEGLPGGPVYAIAENQRGQLWAATAQGLRLFHPEADPDPPRTQVRRLTGEDRRLAEGDTLDVLFDGVDRWKYATRLLYSHQLDQQGWSSFREETTFSFPHLTAGRHYFQVRAMDGNGNVEPASAALNFTVMIPWYRDARWWAVFLPGAAAAVFFAGVAWNRHRRLVRSHAAVEQKVAERTRELEMATRELLHSQKMNALGTLAAGIAHDFNNILSIIKGSAQIIEDNMDQPAKVRTRLERIKTVVQQGAEIVDAMLGFSRGSDAVTSRCDINQVVAETLKLLGDRFTREVEIKFEKSDGLPEVEAPKGFIQQILLNIIFNAAEAMTGRKRILLGTQRVEKLPPEMVLHPEGAAAYILISVRDWGGGMAPETRARIFEPFFTTKAMSSRRGTGLGLSMVYELAKKMGAGLAVASVLNEGSTFTLVLPVRKERLADSAEKITKEQLPS